MRVEDKKVLVIDRESLVLLEGSVVDYEETMAREGYVIQTNPNAE
jgi:Fe-S cluster assembly iron-binding protein IscA